MKILVAEDDPESRYLLQQAFAALGHRVVPVANGQDGLAAVRSDAPDVIVSDALMPLVDGFQFCYSLKRDPNFFRIPFVIYTATYTDDGDERFARRVGVDRFVVKPMEPDKLMRIVSEVVDALKASPPPQPLSAELDQTFFEEYSQRLSLKLEYKISELERANTELRDSDKAIRQLNERLLSTVRALEQQVVEREAAEAALRMREDLLQKAQAVGRLGSWERDSNGTVINCSDEFYKIFGVDSGSVAPTPDWLFQQAHPDDRERLRAELVALEKRGVDYDTEYRVVHVDGAVRNVSMRQHTYRDPAGRPLRYVGIVQDITARRDADMQRASLEAQLRQAQKMEAVGNLAGGIAHDFNNILTAIMAHAELLELELPAKGSANLRESASEIVSACNRARDLVKQILTFSRKQAVERKRVDLVVCVQDVLRLVRATLPRTIDIKTDFAGKAPVLANESQLHQIVLNLCTNASHAMDLAGGAIFLKITPTILTPAEATRRPPLKPAPYAVLEVRDNGRGMDAATLERIFEPFFTTKPVGQGTGLGLAVVHGIIQAHEGAIFVESAPGQGTSFSVYLPTVLESADEKSAQQTLAAKGRGQKVLFVDDEPSVAKIGARLLERLGYEAVALTDPVEARERLVANPDEFALVITDYLMPRVNGLDLARAVWAVRSDLPMILAVGFGGQLDAAKAKAHGFREFVAKPFAIQTLADAIDRSLGR